MNFFDDSLRHYKSAKEENESKRGKILSLQILKECEKHYKLSSDSNAQMD